MIQFYPLPFLADFQAATHIKVVQELMDMLHESQREKAMDKIVLSRPDNIIAPQFRKP